MIRAEDEDEPFLWADDLLSFADVDFVCISLHHALDAGSNRVQRLKLPIL